LGYLITTVSAISLYIAAVTSPSSTYVFLLAALCVPLCASDAQSVLLKSSSVAHGVILVEGQVSGEGAEFDCFEGDALCSAPTPGEYTMVRAGANESIYNDCTNVLLYRTTGSGVKEKVGLYCWLTSGDTYMVTLEPPQAETVPSPVWRWFQTCSESTTMGVDVVLEGKLVYRSSFPICNGAGAPNNSDGKQKTLSFSFNGGHLFQGEYHTAPAQRVKGNIWQAGADLDDLILGVSFATKNQVLLNTVYTVRPGRASESEVDRGIVVKTYPVTHK